MAAGTSYRVFSPEIWSDIFRVYFKSKLFAANFFQDFSAELSAQGGDTITIPHITSGQTAQSLTTTTGDITDPTLAETRTQLTVDTWKAASRKISEFELDRVKKSYDLQSKFLKDDIAYQLAKSLDSALIGTSGVAGNIQLHTGTSLVSINNTAFTEAIRIAESYSLPIEEMAFFVHGNVYWSQMLRRTSLIDASQLGHPTVGAAEGVVYPLGSIFGRPVYVTNQIGTGTGIGGDGYPSTAKRNLFVHPRTLVYAVAGNNPTLRTQPVANALAIRLVGDLKYGVKCAGSYEGVRVITVQ